MTVIYLINKKRFKNKLLNLFYIKTTIINIDIKFTKIYMNNLYIYFNHSVYPIL